MLQQKKIIYDADATIIAINYDCEIKERPLRLAHQISSDTSEHGVNYSIR